MTKHGGASSVCPYCWNSPDGRGGWTRDHVFVAALGGRATVGCCRECNSRIGGEVEGPLQAADGFLNLAAAASGGGKPVPGTFKGKPVSYDLARKELRSTKPVEVTRRGDEITYRYEGSPRQLRQLLQQRGMSEQDIERHIASGTRVDVGGERVKLNLTLPLPLAHRLAAKVGLGAGVLASGPAFSESPLAEHLREVLWGRVEIETSLELAALTAMDELLMEAGKAVNATSLPRLTPDTGDSQVAFLPVADSTAVVVHLAGHSLTMSGRVLAFPMPESAGLPVLVRDGVGGATVHALANALLSRPSSAD